MTPLWGARQSGEPRRADSLVAVLPLLLLQRSDARLGVPRARAALDMRQDAAA
jgi:hypothetical protein